MIKPLPMFKLGSQYFNEHALEMTMTCIKNRRVLTSSSIRPKMLNYSNSNT